MPLELYRDDDHLCPMFSDLSGADGDAVQANQFLIGWIWSVQRITWCRSEPVRRVKNGTLGTLLSAVASDFHLPEIDGRQS
jgi:hypothetical protein